MSIAFASCVFLNCPFDKDYEPLRNAIVFAVYDCGFQPRCALQEDDSGVVRFTKIQDLIRDCKFGIHDISRTELDPQNALPRFNMPLELGVFLGAKRFGGAKHKSKSCLILDSIPYRYQAFISDIAGHDIRAHRNNPATAITSVRDWLGSVRKGIPGGTHIRRRFGLFQRDLPKMCEKVAHSPDELTYNDFNNFVSEWLKLNKDA